MFFFLKDAYLFSNERAGKDVDLQGWKNLEVGGKGTIIQKYCMTSQLV